jgi:hypothetical protein
VKINIANANHEERQFQQRQGKNHDDPKRPGPETSAEKEAKEVERNLPGDRELTKAESARVNRILDNATRGGSANDMGRGPNSGGRGGRGM